MEQFDYLIIGTGQATGTLLGKLIPTGKKIAVIEGHKVGGSCVNYGCTPTKTLVASARAFQMANSGADYGFTAEPTLDFSKVRQRMNAVRNESNKGLSQWLEESENVELIRGWGQFAGPRQVRVGNRQLAADYIIINVGAKHTAPPIKGLDQTPYLDSEGILDLSELPQKLLIVGGGYIGLEFAQVFRRFGSAVTVIQRGAQLMPQEDEDIAASIQEKLEEEGVEVLLNTESQAVSASAEGEIITTLSRQGEKLERRGSHLLIATGRKPATQRLNLAQAGIETDGKGFIKTDDFGQTNVERVFALGDVNGKGAFTHTSVNDAQVLLDHIFGGSRRISQRIPVYALFSDPPLGRVGLSEKEALAQGYQVLKATMPMAKISRAKEMGETHGLAKLLVDAKTDLILGAAIHGPGGDEIINMFAAIMHSGITCKKYREVVLVHPTVSELMPFMLDHLKPVEAE